jgi:hypothetical protein
VSLAHLVSEVDVQPSHPGSSPHGRKFGFLLLKKQIIVGASPTVFFKKKLQYSLSSTSVLQLSKKN